MKKKKTQLNVSEFHYPMLNKLIHYENTLLESRSTPYYHSTPVVFSDIFNLYIFTFYSNILTAHKIQSTRLKVYVCFHRKKVS